MSDGVLRENLASRLDGLIGSMLFDREIDPTKFFRIEPHWKMFLQEVSRLEEYGQEGWRQANENKRDSDEWERKYWNLRKKIEEILPSGI